MGTLFKRVRNGIPSKKWYGKYRNETGKWREEALSTDKTVARRLLVQREREAEDIRNGLTTASRQQALLPLSDHLEAYRLDLLPRPVTAEYIRDTISKCNRIISGCRFNRISDLTESAVATWLARQQFCPASRNRYTTAIKGFARWLQLSRRCPEHRLIGLSGVPVETDRRHERRSLSDADLSLLLETTRTSTRIDQGSDWRFTAEDRYLLYLTAAMTGLRASELASLTVDSFDLDPDAPTVTVQATNTKNKKTAVLPLHPDLARLLQDSCNGLSPDARIWPGSWAEKRRAGQILKRDLKQAKIPYRDPSGRVFDFHSLRGQFITALARADVPLKKAQDLARHSTPMLTANVYTRLHTSDLAESVNRLKLPGTKSAVTKSTEAESA